MKRLRFLFVETFYGGSHRAFADAVVRHSRHEIDLVTLPDRHWRRRLQIAAWQVAERITNLEAYDGLLVTDLVDLSELRGVLARRATLPPVMLYMHESQMTYPPTQRRTPPRELLLLELKNIASAERVLFNSRSHRDTFAEAARAFLATYRTADTIAPPAAIEAAVETAKTAPVHYPGAERCPRGNRAPLSAQAESDEAPLIIWNHRWEYDKDPESFFRALPALARDGVAFRVAILGEESRIMRPRFEAAAAELGDRVVHLGYAESSAAYRHFLESGDLVVSTAIQENFGIAVCEAVLCGCVPVLPRRLSYPELVPEQYHERCLYDDEPGLYRRIRELLSLRPLHRKTLAAELQRAFQRFERGRLAPQLDRELDRLAASR